MLVNIILKNAQIRYMAYVIALIGVEMVMLAVLAPIKVGVRAHFSLGERGLFVIIRFFGINAVRIRIKTDENPIVTVNGKTLKTLDKKPNAMEAINAIRKEKIAFVTTLAALCGDFDEKNKAIAIALCEMFGIECKYFANCSVDGKFDCELKSKFSINLVQVLTVYVKSK